MYHQECLSIMKTDDGSFIISVRVKKKKEKDSKGECCSYDQTIDKTVVAKDMDEVCEHVKTLLPEIEEGYMSEDAFKKAFKNGPEEDEDEE